ncbi:hypothetical protein GGR54DRAFT_217956 [Hypoxylon sp. NC1633]|nr:hypothetical protein GGR54DRAFT_217956 [Hypoxylon sp. NC1633]
MTSPDSPTPSGALPTFGVDKIIAELRNRRCGQQKKEEDEWWCVSLSIDEFKSLEARIEADEDLHGFKYDYFPKLKKFVLRMEDDLHEFVVEEFKVQIQDQLSVLRQSNDQVAADFARKIKSRGSPKVVGEEQERHVPDGSFTHKDSTEHGVILEVSNSQKRRELSFLADDYILGSNGLIQLVIGIDLEYRKTKGMEAKVITWRPKRIEADGTTILEAAQTEDGIFRAADGSLVNGEQILYIGLEDFGNKYDCPGINNIPGGITISFAQLYNIVCEGEEVKQKMKQKRELDDVGLLGVQKRQKPRSPPEELDTQDEEWLQAVKEEGNQRLNDQDDFNVVLQRCDGVGFNAEAKTEQ